MLVTTAVRRMSKVAGEISKTALLPSSDNKHFKLLATFTRLPNDSNSLSLLRGAK